MRLDRAPRVPVSEFHAVWRFDGVWRVDSSGFDADLAHFWLSWRWKVLLGDVYAVFAREVPVIPEGEPRTPGEALAAVAAGVMDEKEAARFLPSLEWVRRGPPIRVEYATGTVGGRTVVAANVLNLDENIHQLRIIDGRVVKGSDAARFVIATILAMWNMSLEELFRKIISYSYGTLELYLDEARRVLSEAERIAERMGVRDPASISGKLRKGRMTPVRRARIVLYTGKMTVQYIYGNILAYDIYDDGRDIHVVKGVYVNPSIHEKIEPMLEIRG